MQYWQLIPIIIGLILFIWGIYRAVIATRSYVKSLVEEQAQKASSIAADEWKKAAEAKDGRIEELTKNVKGLEIKVDNLTKQNEEQKLQMDKMQQTIESMTDVDGVAKLIVGSVQHFDESIKDIQGKLDMLLELGKTAKTAVTVNTAKQ